MFVTLAMPKIVSIGSYHLSIYSRKGKTHSIFSFKLMQGNLEKATFNLNTGEWQAIKDMKALTEVKTDIEFWLQVDGVRTALIQQCENALAFKTVSPISIPLERKALKKYLKERQGNNK